MSELILSQTPAIGMADLCMYLECCLIHQGRVSLLPGIAATGIQLAGSLILLMLNKCSIWPEISPMNYLFRTIASLKFLDDVTASPSEFRLVLVRTMQPASLISNWMEHWQDRQQKKFTENISRDCTRTYILSFDLVVVHR